MAPVYDLSDESLLRYYNSVRGQIEADDATNFRLIGPDLLPRPYSNVHRRNQLGVDIALQIEDDFDASTGLRNCISAPNTAVVFFESRDR